MNRLGTAVGMHLPGASVSMNASVEVNHVGAYVGVIILVPCWDQSFCASVKIHLNASVWKLASTSETLI